MLKLTLLGAPSVGKTSLVKRYVDGYFKDFYQVTMGTTFHSKAVHVDGLSIRLVIWDLGGQKSFARLMKDYIRGAAGSFIVFDVTSRSSFEALTHWINDLWEICPKVPFIIIGNKNDLVDHRAVSDEEIAELAGKYGMDWMTASAKNDNNVNKAFTQLTKQVLDRSPHLSSHIDE